MKDWRALPSKGGLIGIGLTAAVAILFGLSVWLTWLAATAVQVQVTQIEDTTPDTPPDLVTVPTGTNLGTFFLALLSCGLLVAVFYLAYQTRRYFALRYSLDRNAITVDLGDRKQLIPLANIRHVVPAETVLTQMKERVLNQDEDKPEPKNVSSRVAYPRQQPFSTIRPETTEANPAEQVEPLETEIAQDEMDDRGRSYRLTQTAAADASLEHLEPIEVVQAEYVEVEIGKDYFDPDEPDSEEAEITEIEAETIEVRALSMNLNATRNREEGQGKTAEEPVSDKTQPDPFEMGSVNFTVKPGLFNSWPGFYLNRSNVATLGPVQFYSTQPLAKTLLIRTTQQTYAISPRDRQQFVTEFNLRRRLGAIEPVEEGIIKGQFLSHPLWHDRLGRSIIFVGVLLNLLLFAFLIWRFNDLPLTLRIHFNKLGEVDRIGDRGELMLLPFIGLLAVVGNNVLGAILHPKERIVAYLLYGSAVLVQCLTAIALLVIMALSGG